MSTELRDARRIEAHTVCPLFWRPYSPEVTRTVTFGRRTSTQDSDSVISVRGVRARYKRRDRSSAVRTTVSRRSRWGWAFVGLRIIMAGAVWSMTLAGCQSRGVTGDEEGRELLREGSGTPDSGFADRGLLALNSSHEVVNAVVPAQDRTVISVGSAVKGERRGFLLVRILPGGELDARFGTDGRVVTHVGTGDAEAWAAMTLPDGTVVVAGAAVSAVGGESDMALARYDANGNLDPTFGSGGVSIGSDSPGADVAYSVAGGPANRLIVAGQCGRASVMANTKGVGCVRRYHFNGSLDESFALSGTRRVPIRDGVEALRGVYIDDQGRILAAGYSDYGGRNEMTLFRLDPAGSVDSAFGGFGYASFRGRGFSDAFALTADEDKILVAGFSGGPDGRDKDFLVARFLPDGTLDRSFASDGAILDALGPQDDVAFAIDADQGGIVVAGYTSSEIGRVPVVVRYHTSGKLDLSFGDGGRVRVPYGRSSSFRSIAIVPSAVIVAGSAAGEDAMGALVVRLRS